MSEYIKTCRSCTWWIERVGSMGECHRYAPRAIIERENVEAFWPITHSNHGCGDHSEYPR